jgi:hypothetical protein
MLRLTRAEPNVGILGVLLNGPPHSLNGLPHLLISNCLPAVCEGDEESGGLTSYIDTAMPDGSGLATLIAILTNTKTSEGCAAACVWHTECTMVTYQAEATDTTKAHTCAPQRNG